MLTIAIQDVLVPHREIVRDIEACRSIGIEPVRFGLIPFTDIISADDPADLEKPAVPFGSVKIIRLWMQGNTPKGWRIFYDAERFDQRYWGAKIGKLALNDATRCTDLGA